MRLGPGWPGRGPCSDGRLGPGSSSDCYRVSVGGLGDSGIPALPLVLAFDDQIIGSRLLVS
ncbi:MAG: hypothetical protein QOJ66_3733 [Ilumatobacteraceae bacterium]|jgi:hypothetical protein